MTTTDIQNTLYKTIDVIVNKRIEDLHLDKTIECVIDSCIDIEYGKYRVKYGSGFFDAYARNNDEIYIPQTAVYVLVPENDFNNKKTIIGKANTGIAINTDTQDMASIYNGYGIIGKSNLLIPKDNNNENNRFGLCSWSNIEGKRRINLYNYKKDDNLLSIDNQSLKVYLQEAEGFIISGDFQTKLSSSQLITGKENYSLIFNITLKHGKNNYKNNQERWNIEAENIEIQTEEGKVNLNFYKDEIEDIINSYIKDDEKTVKELQQKLLDYKENKLDIFASFALKNETIDASSLELLNLYVQLINELTSYSVNIYNVPISKEELQDQYNAWFNAESYAFTEEDYSIVLDTSKMTGNVYRFSKPTYQYTMITIDPETFVRIKSIDFIAENFEPDDSLAERGEDIFVQNVSLGCIKSLNNTNGDYRLDLSYSDIYFKIDDDDETTLNVVAKLTYKNSTDITEYSRILWFKKNSSITANDKEYNPYGGEGWEHLPNNSGFDSAIPDRTKTLTLKAKDNNTYRNEYKVVIMYESSTTVQQEFTIYNEKYKHDIELVSDSGKVFGIGSGSKTITCMIDDKVAASLDYNFKWMVQKPVDGSLYTILSETDKKNLETNKSTQEEEDWYNAIKDIWWTGEQNGVDKESKYSVIVSSDALSDNNKQIKIICNITTDKINFGQTEIILSNNKDMVSLSDYFIEIINGNQIFQYNEAGVSPASARYENPQVPQRLGCKFYDPAGGIINPLHYIVTWQVPIENTLIKVDDSLLTKNPLTGQKDLLVGDVCDFTISDDYNYSYTNNQIICKIKLLNTRSEEETAEYRQSTNFFFGKIGDEGTNGTDVVVKITPVHKDYAGDKILTEEVLTLNIDKTKEKDSYVWNNGSGTQDPILQLQLFKGNDLVDVNEYKKVSWSMLSNTDGEQRLKYWGTSAVARAEEDTTRKVLLLYDETKNSQWYTNYIVRGEVALPIEEDKYQYYYGFYPLCTKTKYADVSYSVSIDRDRVLRSVTYNADGRNPLYDKNLGVGLTFKNLKTNLTEDYIKKLDFEKLKDEFHTIVWEPRGGHILKDDHNQTIESEQERNPSFSLGKSISWILSSSSEIQEMAKNKLITSKEKEINKKIDLQKSECIKAIKERRQNLINNITETQSDIVNILGNEEEGEISQRNSLWNNLGENYSDAIDEIYGLLEKYFEFDQIENYIYQVDGENVSLYYPEGTLKGTFKNDIATYIKDCLAKDGEARNKSFNSNDNSNESSNDNSNESSNDDSNKLNKEILLKLELRFEKSSEDEEPSEDEEAKNSIIVTFSTLINALVVNYSSTLILYDLNNKELYDNINDLIEQYGVLSEQLTEYEKITEEQINKNETNIKKIIFDEEEESSDDEEEESSDDEEESSGEEESLNDLLLDLVLQQKEEYDQDIDVIEEFWDSQINYLENLNGDSDSTFCSIIPNDVYNGEYSNQYVRVLIYETCYDSIKDIPDDANPEYEIIVPFHMSLNLYGLASINGWDGTSISINEEDGYILAPQIGAGEKDLTTNRFTGIVMGTEKRYDETQTGLFGYSNGARSIFLDAETGNATFGLAEDDAFDVSNPLTEGRIELRPGGISSISKWKFDSRSLYRVASLKETSYLQAIKTRKYTNETSDDGLVKPYEDAPQYAHGSIPHTQQGILLSALPSYVSFKGRQLNAQDHKDKKVNFLHINTTVREGDSFELQIDPNDSQFFTLYEHSSRLRYGEGVCDTLGNFILITNGINLYNLSKEDIALYFQDYVNIEYNNNSDDSKEITKINLKDKYHETDYLICQLYYRTDGGSSVQAFRPLSLLQWDGQEDLIGKTWQLENKIIISENEADTVDEYVIGAYNRYPNWISRKDPGSVWRFISFSTEQEVAVTNYAVNREKQILISLDIDEASIKDRIWRRHRKAGIDATGKFAAETVGVGSIGLELGNVAAFRPNWGFVGGSLEVASAPIIQFFIDKQTQETDTGPVYISSSKNIDITNDDSELDEGLRPIRIYAGKNPKEESNYENWFGEDSFKSGIFVGQTVKKNPTSGIAKIELWQNSKEQNYIELSALGEEDINGDIRRSQLKLYSYDINGTKDPALGGLYHTGNWENKIGGTLNETIGKSVTKNYKDTASVNIIDNFNLTSNKENNKIFSTEDSIQISNSKKNNKPYLQNKLYLQDNARLSTRQGWYLRVTNSSSPYLNEYNDDSYNKKWGWRTNGIAIESEGCQEGIQIKAWPNYINGKKDYDPQSSDINNRTEVLNGTVRLSMLPSGNTQNAKFELLAQAGNYYAGIYNDKNTTIIEQNLQTGKAVINDGATIYGGNVEFLSKKTLKGKKEIPAGEYFKISMSDTEKTISIFGSEGVKITANNKIEIIPNGKKPVILGSPVYVGGTVKDANKKDIPNLYNGNIHGDGQYISNTVNIGDNMYEDKKNKKGIYSIGPVADVTINGSTQSDSFTIPYITFDNNFKRPTFESVQTVSLDLSAYVKTSEIDTAVSKKLKNYYKTGQSHNHKGIEFSIGRVEIRGENGQIYNAISSITIGDQTLTAGAGKTSATFNTTNAELNNSNKK